MVRTSNASMVIIVGLTGVLRDQLADLAGLELSSGARVVLDRCISTLRLILEAEYEYAEGLPTQARSTTKGGDEARNDLGEPGLRDRLRNWSQSGDLGLNAGTDADRFGGNGYVDPDVGNLVSDDTGGSD